jgi:capsular exopolysaccharide synthesis family protein
VHSPNTTRLVEILADSTDPQIAAAFANTLAEEYIQQDVDSRLKDSRRTRDLLNEQSQELKTKLQTSEAQLQEYTRQSGLLVIGEKSNVAEGKLQQLQAQLSDAHADQVLKRSKYETAQRGTPEGSAARLDDGSSRDYRAKLTELRRQLAEQSVLLAPGHYKIQRLQAEIGELESAVGKERTDNLERLRNDYETALQREELLSEAYSNQVRVVSELAVKSIHYNLLKDEITAGRQLYETMLQKLKEASIASVIRPSNARIVDIAKPASFPYKPDKRLNIGLGLFAGLLLGSVWISIRERSNVNVRSPEEARGALNLVELGTIPSAAVSRRPEAAALFAESFRSVLTSILLAERGATRPKVLVVTSPGPGEGKTLMVTNLASALAESQRRVLLIDADIRKPQLHSRFGLQREPGLGDILLNQQPITAEMACSMAQKTSTPGVYVLPAGSLGPSVSTSFYSARMKQILDVYRGEFDYVLIDSPPMLLFSDARALGRQSDAVILVFRANRTSREAAQITGQRLTEDKTRILGIILNDWTRHNGSYSGYYNTSTPAGRQR